MKLPTTTLPVLLALLTLPALPAQEPQAAPQTTRPAEPSIPHPQEAEIRFLFDHYKRALTEKDGVTAAGLLSHDSIQVYEHYREAALSGTKEEILQIPLVHQVGVLVLRGNIPAEALLGMDGRAVYAQCISKGLIAHKWAGSMAVISIQALDKNTALLTIGVKDQPGTKLPVVLEGDTWKISLREILMQSNSLIEKMLSEKGMTPDAYLTAVVESQLGKNAFPNIWNPPAQRVRNAEQVWEQAPH